MRVAYFVHDLADAAVHRRVRMLRNFAHVTLVGFHRSEAFPNDLQDVRVISLGKTVDAQLAQRALMVAKALARQSAWRGRLEGTTVFMARQLEMLVVAAQVRRRITPRVPLVFECLDIHRLMLSQPPFGAALRRLEATLLRNCDMLVVSSPAFVRNHFANYGGSLPPYVVLENKVMATDVPPGLLREIEAVRLGGPPATAPWRIGWFGMIRCRRSLHLLVKLLHRLPGLVEVVIGGRPRRNVIPDFDALVSSTPGLVFLGEYDRHTDLPRIYRGVHFTWAADFFEAGQNSDWLLPNRLYEGTLYGAVPLASASVETGRWLRDRRCGVLFDDGEDDHIVETLVAYFAALDTTRYRGERNSLARIPLSDVLDEPASGQDLGGVLRDLMEAGAR
jgi:hypothetical protein